MWAGFFSPKNHKDNCIVTFSLSQSFHFLFRAEYKASYVRNRSIRSVAVELDGAVYSLGLEDGYQPVLPRNVTKRHKMQRAVLREEEEKDMGEYSGTGGIAEYAAPNLIKVTHR